MTTQWQQQPLTKRMKGLNDTYLPLLHRWRCIKQQNMTDIKMSHTAFEEIYRAETTSLIISTFTAEFLPVCVVGHPFTKHLWWHLQAPWEPVGTRHVHASELAVPDNDTTCICNLTFSKNQVKTGCLLFIQQTSFNLCVNHVSTTAEGGGRLL